MEAGLRQRRRALRILFVCEGNICRSPVAEVLSESRLGSLPVRTESAGLRPLEGSAVPQQMIDATSAWDDDMSLLAEHRSRILTAGTVERADLVLTMTRAQRSEVVSLAPVALHRTFTLREFARLATSEALVPEGDTAGERLRHLAATLIARRVAGRAKGEDDIEDPYGRSARSYQRAAQAIRDAVDIAVPAIADAVTASSGSAPSGAGPAAPRE